MAMNVRRIVTGHNAAGKAVIKTDEQIAAVPRIGAGISGAEIWSTDQMPIDNSAAADAAQRAGFVNTPITWATVAARRSESTSGLPATRDSPTAPRPWTTRSCCQVRLTANWKTVRPCI